MKYKVTATFNLEIQADSREEILEKINTFNKQISPDIKITSMNTIGVHSIKPTKRIFTYYHSPAYGTLTHYSINVNRLGPGNIILGYNTIKDTLIFFQRMILDTDTWITFDYSNNNDRITYSHKDILSLIEDSNSKNSSKHIKFISLRHFSDDDLRYIISTVPYCTPYKFIGISEQRIKQL